MFPFNLFRPKDRWLFYDIEVYENIGYHSEFKYVDGWDSKALMHITCIATYTSWDNAYRIHASGPIPFVDDFDEFQKLVNKADKVISFNGISFDDVVCRANGLKVKTDYDLLQQTWVAAGLPPTYTKGVTVAGYNLEALAQANLGMGKTGSGSLAPQLWQQGKYEQVKLYCLNDVYLPLPSSA